MASRKALQVKINLLSEDYDVSKQTVLFQHCTLNSSILWHLSSTPFSMLISLSQWTFVKKGGLSATPSPRAATRALVQFSYRWQIGFHYRPVVSYSYLQLQLVTIAFKLSGKGRQCTYVVHILLDMLYSMQQWEDTPHPTPMCYDVQKLHQSVQGWVSKDCFAAADCILVEIQSGRHVYSAQSLYLLLMCHDMFPQTAVAAS